MLLIWLNFVADRHQWAGTRHRLRSRVTAGCLLLLLALAMSARASSASTDDLATVTQRLRERILVDAPPATAALAGWLGAQRPDGSWPDIDYADHNHAGWQPLQHLERLRALAVAHEQAATSPEQGKALHHAYSQALDYWVRNKKTIYSGNWWFGRIGEQIQLGEGLLVMRPALTAEQVRAGSALLQADVLGCGLSDVCTGQNLVWTSTASIYKGCLEDNPAYVALGFGAIQGTVVVTAADEGLQADNSFRQHRAQLYSGGYGLGFVRDVATWISASQGTAYAFSAPTVDLFSRLVLDGDAWMVRGEVFDYSTQGREIARHDISAKARQLASACDRLAALHTAREQEFTALAASIRSTGPPLRRGNRHFWRADYMAHQQPGFSASVRLWSKRTAGLENFNKENIKGYYLPQGTTLLYRRGDEYKDIFPVWDWTRLPGVTCPQAATPPPLPAPGEYAYGPTDFVGGVSDGAAGLAAFDYRQEGVTARKSWFCFDEGFLCLGAGITSTGSTPLITSVNQCLLAGPLTGALLSGQPMTQGELGSTADAVSWVHHDGVGYWFPAGGVVVAQRAAQTGSWRGINDQFGYEAEPVTKDVFSVWLTHGVAPQNATYQYVVLPGQTPKQVAAYARKPPLRVLCNTPALQAVHHEKQGLTALAFYEAGQLDLPRGLRVRVDQPCLLLLRREGRQLTITAANPRNEALALTVSLSARLTGAGAELGPAGQGSQVRLALPGGQEAGRSVSRSFTLP